MSLLNLEGGFLRSPGLGVAGCPSYSIIYGDIDIYYDTTRPSRLEQLVLTADAMPSKALEQAQQAVNLILEHRLSKYNHAPELSNGHPLHVPSKSEIVLIIDQALDDMAIRYSGADAAIFKCMPQTALNENPQADIWAKTHLGVLYDKKQDYLIQLAQRCHVYMLAKDINPISLLQNVDKVYCITSQMGFEALLCGEQLTTFGLPWYAGRGIGDDRHPGIDNLTQTRHCAPRTLLQLFATVYLQYSRYLNPNTGEAGSLFNVIDYLVTVKRRSDKLHDKLYCVDISLWKRIVIKPFFNVPSCRLEFIPSTDELAEMKLPSNMRILTWGNGKDAIVRFAEQHNIPFLHMEDGFIRSVGFGPDLVPPLSLVTDDMGIYFNTEAPSRLEHILQNQIFSKHGFQMASVLQKASTEDHISRYNVDNTNFTVPPTDKTVILVPGQVENGAFVRHGSPQIRRNLDSLRTVREHHPDAYIIYKPHPGVVSGNRTDHINAEDTARYADRTAPEANILTCLQYADKVHTMTSLAGFEALLRDKRVCYYGLPLYAGWGLTQDLLPTERHGRRLELRQLIVGILVYYPDYVHPEKHHFIDAATAVEILKNQKSLQKSNTSLYRSWFEKQIGGIHQLCRSLL